MKKTHKKTVIGYARTGSPKADSYLNNQLDTIKNFCKENKYLVSDMVSDKGKREFVITQDDTGHKEVLKAIKNHKVDAIVCTSIDRIARSSAGYYIVKNLAELYGVELIFIDRQSKETTIKMP